MLQSLSLLLFAMPCGPARAVEPIPARLLAPPDNVARLRAIDGGLAWLADEVRNGSWPTRPSGAVASASLAGLAFMAAGARPDNPASPCGPELRRCLNFVRQNIHPAVGIAATPGDGTAMTSHAWATVLLAETRRYAPGDEALPEQSKNAVRFIHRMQGEDGSWAYRTDGAVPNARWTALQLNALLAARAAGVPVDEGAVRRGLAYLHACERAGDGFASTPQNPTAHAAWSAFAVVPLGYSEPDRAAARLDRLTRLTVGINEGDYAETLAHAAWAAYLDAGKYRAAGHPALCRELMGRQRPEGWWHVSKDGMIYDTALALIVLQMPRERLVTLTPRPAVAPEAQGNPATRPVSRPAGAP